MASEQLFRRPFARDTVVCRAVGEGFCAWCGTVGDMKQYGTDPDAGRTAWIPKGFCDRDCCEAYHNINLEE